MNRTAALALVAVLAVGCGDNAQSADAFEQSMNAMMRNMEEPERAEFCEAAADEGRTETLEALRRGFASSTDDPFHEDIAATVVWEWCDEIESDSPDAW